MSPESNPRQRLSLVLIIMTMIAVMVFWSYFLFAVPTFDLDESLYRRAAEEMKWSGNFWKPTWDANALFHKPPVLFWMMIGISYLWDGAEAGVSIFSARLPSVLASLGILISLFSFGKKLKLQSPVLLPLTFCTAIFPLVTASSAIFDPIQTLLLLPTLFLPTLWMFDQQPGTWIEWVFYSLSLFAATAFKGLNGMIVPTFAYGLMIIFQFKHFGWKGCIAKIAEYILKALLPAGVLLLAWFVLLDIKMGRSFTQEFFWIHHFGRSSAAMEDHGGSYFYHIFVILFGSGFLWPDVVSLLIQQKWKIFKNYPVIFVMAFVIVFSFSATKLPHYTWPIWPALAIAVSLNRNQPNGSRSSLVFFLQCLPLLSMMLLAGFAMILSQNLTAGSLTGVLDQIKLSEQATSILKYFPGFSPISTVLLLLIVVLCGLQIWKLKRNVNAIATAITSVMVSIFLVLAFIPPVVTLWVDPYYSVIAEIKKTGLKPNECIRYNGQHSPSLSLALGKDLVYNKHCEPPTANFLITPEWKLKECDLFGMRVVYQDRYLFLCKRD
jgi:4-amino-4-deoxy-L-arabinose transferase-like glycosyltransferase